MATARGRSSNARRYACTARRPTSDLQLPIATVVFCPVQHFTDRSSHAAPPLGLNAVSHPDINSPLALFRSQTRYLAQQIDSLLQQGTRDHLECLCRLAQLARLGMLMQVVVVVMRHGVNCKLLEDGTRVDADATLAPSEP